jgi:uncharacterized protein (DUF433 family)
MAVKATRRDPPASRISRDPRILDGEPVVRGTRVPVRAIVLAHRIYPTIERLAEAFPTLTIQDIGEALAFYQANRDEIDQYITENAIDET